MLKNCNPYTNTYYKMSIYYDVITAMKYTHRSNKTKENMKMRTNRITATMNTINVNICHRMTNTTTISVIVPIVSMDVNMMTISNII